MNSRDRDIPAFKKVGRCCEDAVKNIVSGKEMIIFHTGGGIIRCPSFGVRQVGMEQWRLYGDIYLVLNFLQLLFNTLFCTQYKCTEPRTLPV